MNISDIFHISHISGVFQAYLGCNSNRSKIHLKFMSGISREYPKYIVGLYKAFLMHISEISSRYFRYMLSIYQANFLYVTVVSRIHLKHILDDVFEAWFYASMYDPRTCSIPYWHDKIRNNEEKFLFSLFRDLFSNKTKNNLTIK